MTLDWLNIPGAVDTVKAQLTGSGVPLEVRTAQACRDFVDQHNAPDTGLEIREQRRIYSDDAEGTVFREVDREVTFYQWVPISQNVYWILSIIVPIECKRRDNIHIIGFPSELFEDSEVAVPMRGPVGSSMLNKLRFLYPDELLREPVTVPSLIQINIDTQANKLGNIKRVDERLVYNAAGSLYDYVKANVPPMPTTTETTGLDYLSTLVNTAHTEHTHPWQLYRTWTLQRDQILPAQDETFQQYNQLRHPDGTLIFSTDVYFPILCVESPLYLAEFAPDHSIANIIPKDFLLSAATIARWPEQTPHYFVNIGKELLISVTTPAYLGSMLGIIHRWFLSLAITLQDNVDMIMQAPLESAAYEYLMQLSHTKDIKLWAGAR